MPTYTELTSIALDHVVDISAIAAIAVMVLHGQPSYEPIAAIASIALGKAYMKRKA